MRVFISSTFTDLKPHRESVFRALQTLGVQADDMIYWPADERPPAGYSADRVRQADVMVLLVAHRYGHIPPGESVSITEREYRTAREADVPVLAFFIDDDAPWPPKAMELEQRDRLERFKAKVREEGTPETFESADQLAALVTASLASFRDRHADLLAAKKRFGSKTIRVDVREQLRKQANCVVELGTAEDGLPLLMAIVRTPDPATELDKLTQKLRRTRDKPESSLLEKLQHTLFRKNWAEEQILPVLDRETLETTDLFVTPANLSELFQSSLELLLNSLARRQPTPTESLLVRPSLAGQEPPEYKPPRKTPERPITAHVFLGDLLSKVRPLESVGGANRFLGLSLTDKRLFSVGLAKTEWLTWRRFLPESLPIVFPGASVEIDRSERIPIASYSRVLFEHAVTAGTDDGRIGIEVEFFVSRQDLAGQLIAIAESLHNGLHSAGRTHGDLKPQNILLTPEGVALIDAFSLDAGEISPGFTPGWSAPEQILGEPTSARSDLYPLGRMVAQLLSGQLVGEVRKFRTPFTGELTEIDVLHNPWVWVGMDPDIEDMTGLKEWRALAHSCLRFDPAGRPSTAAEFAERLGTLQEEYPLPGEAHVQLQSNLVAATLPDGRDVVARLVAT